MGVCGCQRKEQNDLIASVQDGRLAKELSQMVSLNLAVLIVEGKQQWSRDGYLLTARSWTMAQQVGVLLSIQSRGCWLLATDSLDTTANTLTYLEKWLSKANHGGLNNRPKPVGSWGKADSREWGIHLLQSFSGIGPEVAGRIYDTFGGVPLQWTVDEIDLMAVKGVGATRAEKMISSLENTS
jgi:ERCC4-type nuclease